MKKLSHLCIILTLLFSHAMCAFVAFSYRDMLCGISHAGYSAPASIAFLYLLIFLPIIAICLVLALKFRKR